MIVFTATNKVTNEVYVGSAKDGMEEQWARLLVQADEGGAGEFLASIREFGADNFQVEMWSYADSPAESRELSRDACDELNAKLIRTGRAPAPTVESTLQQEKSEATSTAPPKKEAVINNITSIRNASSLKQERTSSKTTKIAERQSQREHGPVQSIDVSAYLASQKEISEKQEKHETNAGVVSLRQKDSTKDFDDMKEVMMRIEMKRRQNRKSTSSGKAKATSKTTSATKHGVVKQVNDTSRAAPAKDKLPDGRVSSSTKEKRIKEAIAKEKMEREAAQAAKAAAEAKEMAAIMAKLDQRSKETERIRRRR